MPVAYFIVPYTTIYQKPFPLRFLAINEYSENIERYAEVEVLGNRAIVKVRAPAAVLTTLAGVFRRLPVNALDNPLNTLTNPQKTALRNELLDMGYTSQEIQARFGSDLGAYTLGDVLRFMASRRRETRYDAETDTVVYDGDIVTPGSVDELDRAVE